MIRRLRKDRSNRSKLVTNQTSKSTLNRSTRSLSSRDSTTTGSSNNSNSNTSNSSKTSMVEERRKKSKKLAAMSMNSTSSKNRNKKGRPTSASSSSSTTHMLTKKIVTENDKVRVKKEVVTTQEEHDIMNIDRNNNSNTGIHTNQEDIVKESIFDDLLTDNVEVALKTPPHFIPISAETEMNNGYEHGHGHGHGHGRNGDVNESKQTVLKKKMNKNTIIAASGEIVEPHNWGFPGYLTQKEEDIYQEFAAEISKRGESSTSNKPSSWRDTIFSFGYNEEEQYAYCRWLRARKFVLSDTITMIEEATALRAGVGLVDFYPDAEVALGVEEAVFKTQYPQVFAGYAKNSCPLFVSKPGRIQMTGLECITTIANMHKYQWHAMIHGAGAEYRARQRADEDFRRFQSVAILDLEGLGFSTITGSVMEMIKHQSYVDSLCFPETMNRLVVINAPGFFSATWNIIRRWLDVRTANKIEIYAARSKWEKRLKALVDNDQLPEDYGGYGPSLDNSILMKCNDLSVSRRITHVMTFKVHGSSVVTLEEGELMDVIIYTKSRVSAEFSVVNAANKSMVLAEGKIVKLPVGGKEVSKTRIALNIAGPGRFKIYGDIENGGFYSSSSDYLMIANITKMSGCSTD